MKKYVIGVDIGGRSMKFGLFTTEGELLEKSNVPTHVENNGEAILPDLVDHLKKMIEKDNLTKENLVGIGIGVPGPILNKSIVKTAVNLGWGDRVNLAGYVEEKLGYKVLVENDANVAALGEVWKGAGKDYDNIVMVTLGTGVGGGIIVDGKILSGTTGSAGEIGHMPFLQEPLQRKCGCGANRCLEQVASATGLEHVANDYLFNHDDASSLRGEDNLGSKAIFDAAIDGDQVANKIVDAYCDNLGRGLAIISAVVDPSMFVIGGGVSNAGEFLIKRLQHSYQKFAFSVTRDCLFSIAELGNDAGIYGAAELILV